MLSPDSFLLLLYHMQGPQSGPGSEGSKGSACLWQAGSEGDGGACGAVGIGTGTWAVLSSIPEG